MRHAWCPHCRCTRTSSPRRRPSSPPAPARTAPTRGSTAHTGTRVRVARTLIPQVGGRTRQPRKHAARAAGYAHTEHARTSWMGFSWSRGFTTSVAPNSRACAPCAASQSQPHQRPPAAGHLVELGRVDVHRDDARRTALLAAHNHRQSHAAQACGSRTHVRRLAGEQESWAPRGSDGGAPNTATVEPASTAIVFSAAP